MSNSKTKPAPTNTPITIDYMAYTAQKIANVITTACQHHNEFYAMARQLVHSIKGRQLLADSLIKAMAPARKAMALEHGHSTWLSYETMLRQSVEKNATGSKNAYKNAAGTKIGQANQNTMLNSVQSAIAGKTDNKGVHIGTATATAPNGYKWSFDIEAQTFTIDIKAAAKKQAGTSQTGKASTNNTNDSAPLSAGASTGNTNDSTPKLTPINTAISALQALSVGDIKQLAYLITHGTELVAIKKAIEVSNEAIKMREEDKEKAAESLAIAEMDFDAKNATMKSVVKSSSSSKADKSKAKQANKIAAEILVKAKNEAKTIHVKGSAY